MANDDKAPTALPNGLEVEYNALRAEILARDEAERSTLRFFLPAAAVAYTVPYFAGERAPALLKESSVFLWTFCASAAGLLVLVMVFSLFWASDGTRKIGTYIKECLERRSNGGLRWEHAVFEFTKVSANWPNETFVVAAGAVCANILAGWAVGATFLEKEGSVQYLPLWFTLLLAAPTLPALWRLMTPRRQRERHAQVLKTAGLVDDATGGGLTLR